jgi:hypothetical protein
VFSFPVAASANTLGHWAIAAPHSVAPSLAWLTLVFATATIALLTALSARLTWTEVRRFARTWRPTNQASAQPFSQ